MSPAPPTAADLPLPSIALVVLDGWGIAPPGPGNAISLASTPVFDSLWDEYPHTQLEASGEAVGLPPGQMGNSEVGHLNLGAGTVVKQDLARIDDAIADKSFFENEALRAACGAAREGTGRLHLIGLVSAGGVHSSLEHLRACIELAARERVAEIVLHALTDGRDTPPTASPEYLAQAESWIEQAREAGVDARIGTVMGRYWGMDRDRRWDRTKRAYDAIVHGEGLARRKRTGSGPAGVRARRDRRVHPADGDRRAGRDALRRQRARRSTSGRTGCARSWPRSASPSFDEFDRGDAPSVTLTTMTRLSGALAVPGRVPARSPGDHDRGRARRARRSAAPRCRDREVRARDVLLQRRGGGPVQRRGAMPRSLTRGTSPPTTTSLR